MGTLVFLVMLTLAEQGTHFHWALWTFVGIEVAGNVVSLFGSFLEVFFDWKDRKSSRWIHR